MHIVLYNKYNLYVLNTLNLCKWMQMGLCCDLRDLQKRDSSHDSQNSWFVLICHFGMPWTFMKHPCLPRCVCTASPATTTSHRWKEGRKKKRFLMVSNPVEKNWSNWTRSLNPTAVCTWKKGHPKYSNHRFYHVSGAMLMERIDQLSRWFQSPTDHQTIWVDQFHRKYSA